MTPRALAKLAHDLQGRSAATVDAELQRRQLSPEERIALHHEIAAATAQDQINEMRASAGGAPQAANEAQRLLARAGFRLGQWYSSADVDRLLTQATYSSEDRIACRIELQELRMTGASRDRTHQFQANAARPGRVLTDRRGRPIVLRAYAE
jgi:hypothetical protein